MRTRRGRTIALAAWFVAGAAAVGGVAIASIPLLAGAVVVLLASSEALRAAGAARARRRIRDVLAGVLLVAWTAVVVENGLGVPAAVVTALLLLLASPRR